MVKLSVKFTLEQFYMLFKNLIIGFQLCTFYSSITTENSYPHSIFFITYLCGFLIRNFPKIDLENNASHVFPKTVFFVLRDLPTEGVCFCYKDLCVPLTGVQAAISLLSSQRLNVFIDSFASWAAKFTGTQYSMYRTL